MQKTLPYQTKQILVYHEWSCQGTYSHQGTQHFSKTIFFKSSSHVFCSPFHLWPLSFILLMFCLLFVCAGGFLLALPWGTNQNHFHPCFNTLLFIIVKYQALPAYSVMLLPKLSKQLATIKTPFFSCGQQLITDTEF